MYLISSNGLIALNVGIEPLTLCLIIWLLGGNYLTADFNDARNQLPFIDVCVHLARRPAMFVSQLPGNKVNLVNTVCIAVARRYDQ